jgi:hypothetical protein
MLYLITQQKIKDGIAIRPVMKKIMAGFTDK